MFTYEYLKLTEIFQNIKVIKNFSISELVVLILLIALFILSVYIIFPIAYIYYQYLKNIFEKKRKKYLLRQIALEKEIEEEMQREMEQH